MHRSEIWCAGTHTQNQKISVHAHTRFEKFSVQEHTRLRKIWCVGTHAQIRNLVCRYTPKDSEENPATILCRNFISTGHRPYLRCGTSRRTCTVHNTMQWHMVKDSVNGRTIWTWVWRLSPRIAVRRKIMICQNNSLDMFVLDFIWFKRNWLF